MGNFVVEYFIAFFGIKYTFVLSALIYTIATLIFTYTTSFSFLLFAAFMIGFHDQCTMMNAIKSIKCYSVEPYATKYVSWAMTGYATGPFLWPFLLTRLINPENLKKTDIFKEGGMDIAYFSADIVLNFDFFMKFQLLLYMLVIGSLLYLFESPPGSNGVFWRYLGHLKKGETDQAAFVFHQSVRLVKDTFHNVVKDSIHQTGVFPSSGHLKNSLVHRKTTNEDKLLKNKINLVKTENRNFKNSINLNPGKSFKISKNPKMETFEEINENYKTENIEEFVLGKTRPGENERVIEMEGQRFSDLKMEPLNPDDQRDDVSEIENDIEEAVIRQEIRRDMLSLNFLIIVLLGIIRTSTSRYYLSNFKLLGLYYFDDDQTINRIGSLSYIFYIIQGFTYPRTLEYLQIKNCYVFTFVGFAVVHCVYCLAPDSLVMYIILTFVHRVCLLVFPGIYKNDRIVDYVYCLWGNKGI